MTIPAPLPPNPHVPVPPRAPRTLGRVPGLDGIRGFAVFAVVMSHFIRPSFMPAFSAGFMRSTFDGGYLGVDIFFVLSGFLITCLLLGERRDHGRVRFGGFYARRALRLLPALYVMLAINLLYVTAVGRDVGSTLWTSLSALLYANNWQGVWRPHSVAPGLGHLWSLSVEEQFYLIWPALLIAFLALNRRVTIVVPVFVATIDVILIHRIGVFERWGWLDAFVRTDTRADSLLIGALTAWLWMNGYFRSTRWKQIGTLAVPALLLFVFFAPHSSDPVMAQGGFTVFALIVALVLIATVNGSMVTTHVFGWRPLCVLGLVSYGLYLWHFPVFSAVTKEGGDWPVYVRAFVALAATGLITFLSWKLVERPFGRMRKRFETGEPELATTS